MVLRQPARILARGVRAVSASRTMMMIDDIRAAR